MTEAETARLVGMVQALWTREPLAAETDEIWHPFLEAFELTEAEAAVRELHVHPDPYAGRSAPDVGMIVRKIAERASNAPDFDEVREEILTAIHRYRPPRDVAATNPYAGPPDEYWSHPLIAAFAENVWDEWRMAPDAAAGDFDAARTFYAQQRDAYKALRARSSRDRTLTAVGAARRPALRQLDTSSSLALVTAAGEER